MHNSACACLVVRDGGGGRFFSPTSLLLCADPKKFNYVWLNIKIAPTLFQQSTVGQILQNSGHSKTAIKALSMCCSLTTKLNSINQTQPISLQTRYINSPNTLTDAR